MRATIHAMNIFVRAVESNSFAAVARSLFIDPGAVSRTIKSLETELGVLLFVRSTRRTGGYGTSVREQTALVGPDVGRADHLAPLFGFVDNEFREFGPCHRYRLSA